jgi:hypothetical protein
MSDFSRTQWSHLEQAVELRRRPSRRGELSRQSKRQTVYVLGQVMPGPCEFCHSGCYHPTQAYLDILETM